MIWALLVGAHSKNLLLCVLYMYTLKKKDKTESISVYFCWQCLGIVFLCFVIGRKLRGVVYRRDRPGRLAGWEVYRHERSGQDRAVYRHDRPGWQGSVPARPNPENILCIGPTRTRENQLILPHKVKNLWKFDLCITHYSRIYAKEQGRRTKVGQGGGKNYFGERFFQWKGLVKWASSYGLSDWCCLKMESTKCSLFIIILFNHIHLIM